MNNTFNAALISLVIATPVLATPALAAKPETAGKGTSKHEQMDTRHDMKNAHPKNKVEAKAEPYRLTEEEQRQRAERQREAQENKQREQKTEQVRKELDKGSEQGQKARAENSKKWWKFW